MEETFKDIPGYEGLYQVSNTGRVFSIRRNKLMKTWLTHDGYPRVGLSKLGKDKFFTVHKLIALTFFGPSELDVNHIDGNKENNYISNLEYVTKRENTLHAYKLGVMPNKKGSNHHNSKLTEKEVLEIRELVKNGKDYKEVSNIYDVTSDAIRMIYKRKRWKHI